MNDEQFEDILHLYTGFYDASIFEGRNPIKNISKSQRLFLKEAVRKNLRDATSKTDYLKNVLKKAEDERSRLERLFKMINNAD